MREWPNPDLRAKFQRQAVALAQAILDGREPVVPSAQRMSALLRKLGLEDSDPAASPFRTIVRQTAHLPIGNERQYWDAQALERKDREIAQVEAAARDSAFAACREIIQRFPLAPRNGRREKRGTE